MPNARALLDVNGDGCLSDGERDEDGDMLSNYDELSGRMVPGSLEGAATRTRSAVHPRTTNGHDWLDGDSDGDGTIDGHATTRTSTTTGTPRSSRAASGASRRPSTSTRLNPDGTPVRNTNGDPIVDKVPKYPVGTAGLWVNPFNPCYPDTSSRSCDRCAPSARPGPSRPRWPPVAGPSGPQPPSHLIARPH